MATKNSEKGLVACASVYAKFFVGFGNSFGHMPGYTWPTKRKGAYKMGKLTINLCEELHQKIREDVAADESLTTSLLMERIIPGAL